MEHFILQLGMMSLQASVVICVVLLVRLLFVQLRVPKKYMCILWMLPYLCMICPWKFESSFGFWRMPEQVEAVQVQEALGFLAGRDGQNNGDQYVQNIEEIRAENLGSVANMEQGAMAGGLAGDVVAENVVSGDADARDTVSTVVDSDVSYLTGNSPDNSEGGGIIGWADADTITNSNIVDISGVNDRAVGLYAISLGLNILGYIWFSGITVVLAYSTISYLRLRQKLICSVRMEENIYIADGIDVPFVLGIFRPRIYLPSDLPQESLEYVVTHERTHIRRRDPLKKIMTLGISALHWFNPLAWVAFHFLEKDMEMACDEETIQKLGLEHKKDYAEALLTLSSGKKFFLGAPLAFDEGNVKGRICNILKYKKVWRAVTGFAVVLIAVLTVCFMTRSTDGRSTMKEQQGEMNQQENSGESAQAESEDVAANSSEATENEDEEQPEAAERQLAEYLIDFTGDKIDERIVFEVNDTEVKELSNAEILEQVWAGELSLHVKVLEGIGNDTPETNATENILWEGCYSGKAEENGNLGVCKYMSDNYLLRYSNDVTDGQGRFWYELLSFESGEAIVYASNEAVYDVVNLQELEGQELTAEYIAMVEQVKLVEKELQRYLNANWIENILLNALIEPEDCYLYQGTIKAWGDAFESFAEQAVGTGFELKVEDFFYPYAEGTTVLPEDARERVLAGELLYMDVTEENATAGNFDLDGDGQTERIYLEAMEWNDRYEHNRIYRSDYRLRINNVYYEAYGDSLDAQVMLFSPDGETILLALYDDGPSADPSTIFFRYDSENKQILWAGEIGTDLRRANIEDGVIKGSFHTYMIGTQYAAGYWIWDGKNIVLRQDEVYEFYQVIDQADGEVVDDGYLKLKETLTVYTERSEESEAFTMNPQKVLCVKSDLKEWIYLVAEDGTEGWLRVEDYTKIPSLDKDSSEVFDGLSFAG